ncbi:uncharacterized protein METZ01_LOCUS375083 [marine metagenome]|uniref:Uncharacterized protein n=1 Tax=marine metagenome TaxID=408172 RepID=A0A382TJE3_9ZZZZ
MMDTILHTPFGLEKLRIPQGIPVKILA